MTEPLPGVEPVPLAPPESRIEGDSHRHLITPLQTLGRELGYGVEIRELPDEAPGLVSAALRERGQVSVPLPVACKAVDSWRPGGRPHSVRWSRPSSPASPSAWHTASRHLRPGRAAPAPGRVDRAGPAWYVRRMRRFRWIALALLLSLLAAAPAGADSMVFIKRGDIWMSRPDGSRQVAVTRNGRPGAPYFSPSVADDGTIVALKGIHLHSFRPNGRRIVKARQWALNPSQALSSEPIAIDLSPHGRVVATDNAFYSTYYDPRRSEERPTLAFRYVDFLDFRRNKEIGRTDAYYDYGVPSWIDSERVLTTSYGIFNAQVLEARVGRETRGSDFFRDPERDPNTGTNAWVSPTPRSRARATDSRSCAGHCRRSRPAMSASARSRSTARAIPRRRRRRSARSDQTAGSARTPTPPGRLTAGRSCGGSPAAGSSRRR